MNYYFIMYQQFTSRGSTFYMMVADCGVVSRLKS